MAFRVVASLIASIAAMLVAVGMLTPLVPLRAAASGFEPRQIGWIAGAYYAGFLIGPWLAPAMTARLGARGAFAAAAVMGAGGVIVMPLVHDPAAWAGLRLLSGTGFAILYILVEAGLNAEGTNANRGRLLSAYIVVSKSAMILGQALIGVTGIDGALPFYAAAGAVIAAGLLRFAGPGSAATSCISTGAPQLRPFKLARTSPVAAVGCILYGMTEAALFALAPLFASDKGFDVAAVAAFMSALLLGGALAQFPLGMLADRVDRRKILLVGAAGAVAAALFLASPLRPGLAWALAGSFALGACELPLYALCVALANDGAAPHQRIEISSGVVFAYAAGAVTGPPVAAALMESGSFALPLFVAVAYALLVIILLVAIRRSPHARSASRDAAAVILSDISV